MKHIWNGIIVLCLTLAFTCCENHDEKSEKSSINQSEADSLKKAEKPASTKIVFEETKYNFGKVTEGDLVEHTFKFKNAGDHPLIVSNARASCGCTIPEWTKEPVAPGQDGKITVTYNSSGKSGAINKTVSVYSNTEPEENVLNISVEVMARDDSKGPLKNK